MTMEVLDALAQAAVAASIGWVGITMVTWPTAMALCKWVARKERMRMEAMQAAYTECLAAHNQSMREFALLLNYGAHDEAITLLKEANAKFREGVKL